MSISAVRASSALELRQLAQTQQNAAQSGQAATGTQASAGAQSASAGQASGAKPAGAKPAGPPPGGGAGGAKPAAASSSSESEGSDTSKIYDKRDANQDGVVSYEEEQAYAAKHPGEAEKSPSGASSSSLQAGLRAYREANQSLYG